MSSKINSLLKETIKLQQIASNPEHSVFVAASAGTGKTKILTDRVLRLLLKGIKPGKILCLTFTKVAAHEMKSRIYDTLSRWSYISDENLKKELLLLTGVVNHDLKKSRVLFAFLLEEFDGLKINTIHSFCKKLMVRFPIEAKIRPNFETIDKYQESFLLKKSIEKFFNDAVFNKKFAKKIIDISLSLNEREFYKIILEMISNKEKLVLFKNKFEMNDAIKKIYSTLRCSILENKNNIIKFYSNQIDRVSLINLSKILFEQNKSTYTDKSKIISLYLNDRKNSNELFNKYKSIFLTSKLEAKKINSIIGAKLNKDNTSLEIIITNEQRRLLDLTEKLSSFAIAKMTNNILSCSDQIIRHYQKLKENDNVLDYNDLITKTNTLLSHYSQSQWIKYKLDESIEHVLIDESQDTNNSQWQVIKSITEDFFSGETAVEKNRTIFIVGDEKQSIYSFQGANPDVFRTSYFYYKSQISFINKKIKEVHLTCSFRSGKSILNLVDKTFLSKKEYANSISRLNTINHSPISDKKTGKVEIWPIINTENQDSNKSSKEILAELISKTIKDWIDNKRLLTDEDRIIEYRDIMILLKNRTNNLGNLIAKYLKKYNIPVSINNKISLVNNIIIQDLISVAKFLLLQEEDLNLACLLKSPICNISEKELFKLSIFRKKEDISLYESLRINNLDIYSFLKKIVNFYNEDNYKIYELYIFLLENLDVRKCLTKHFGREADEIINHFLLLILNYQKNHLPNLQSFIHFISESEELLIKNDSTNFNEVKITTIHSSKGLESPIIFLADTAHSKKNKFGNKEMIIWNEENLPFFSIGESKILKLMRSKTLAIEEEYLRSLYVGMTRAKNELYITGFGDNICNNSWYKIITMSLGLQNTTKDFKIFNEIYKQKEKIILLGIKEELFAQSDIEEKEENIDEYFDKTNLVENDRKSNIIYPSDVTEYKKSSKNLSNKGKLIHKILEIGNINSNIHNLLDKYLAKYFLTEEDREDLYLQISNILHNPKFAFLFSKNSKSEVPIAGEIDGQKISGKIDKLIMKDNNIIIIDYKSGKMKEYNEDQINNYKLQLTLYSKLLTKIYPSYSIKMAIIWTNSAEVTYI